MRRVTALIICFLVGLAAAESVIGQDAIRYYEENGATIREARTKVQVPVQDPRYPTQTGLPQLPAPPVTTAARRPVTQYQWVPKWHGRWNLIRGPHLAYHLEPRQTWTTTPTAAMASTALIAPTPTAQVASAPVRYEEREQITRTVMLPGNNNSVVTLPSDRLRANNEAVALARAPFNAGQLAAHPRYAPRIASNTLPAARPSLAGLPAPPVSNAPAPVYPSPAIVARAPAYSAPLSSGPNFAAPRIASNRYLPANDPAGVYGGVARLDGDYPRYSTNNPQGIWQAQRQTEANTVNR